MNEPPEWLKTYLLNRYKESSYANFLQMQILELNEGEITVSMLVRHELTNLSRSIHGGAVGSLLDMAMNLACFSTGRRTLILGFNVNFLSGARQGRTVLAVTRVLHNGRRTMVVEGRVIDEHGKLLAKGRGTFVVLSQFAPEDAQKSAAPLPPSQEAPRKPENLPEAKPETKKLTGWLGDLLLHVHDRNYFAKYLGMEIDEIGECSCVVSMPVTRKHINMRGVVHGGALVSLADMSMMLACATLGKHTVTLDLNVSFVRRVTEGDTIRAYPLVIHKGKTTMVVRTDVNDKAGKLLAEARGTLFVTGDYTPEEWE